MKCDRKQKQRRRDRYRRRLYARAGFTSFACLRFLRIRLLRGDPKDDDGLSACMRPSTLGDAGAAGDRGPNRPEKDMFGECLKGE